jgi:hypothetical protein
VRGARVTVKLPRLMTNCLVTNELCYYGAQLYSSAARATVYMCPHNTMCPYTTKYLSSYDQPNQLTLSRSLAERCECCSMDMHWRDFALRLIQLREGDSDVS